MEWLLSVDDVIRWGSALENSDSSEYANKILIDLKQFLAKNNLYIGPATFTSGFTLVLHSACRSDAISMIQHVLDHHQGQFDINQLILHHQDSSYYYYKRENISISTQLKHHKETLVHAAIKFSSTNILKLLVSHGASVNIPDCCSVTPLLRAVDMYNCLDTVKYLIQAGANIDYQDRTGHTALMYSIKNKDNFELLLKAGADPYLTDKRGYNVIHEAISQAANDSLESLLLFKILPFPCPQTTRVQPLFLADRVDFMSSNNSFHRFHLSYLPERSLCPPHFKIDFLLYHPQCPPNLKVDILLLNATCLFYDYVQTKVTSSATLCSNQFEDALNLRAELKVPALFEPIEAYSGLTEIASIEEFKKKYSDLTNTSTQVNLAYQCLIIRERCLGYGDSTVVECLLTFGEWMLSSNYYIKGLLMWRRAAEMLHSHLINDTILSDLLELQLLLKKSFKACISFTKCVFPPTLDQQVTEVVEDLSKHDCKSIFVLIVSNLVECQCLSTEQYKRHHVHQFSPLYEDAHLNLLLLLHNLSESQVLSARLDVLVQEAVGKCPHFVTASGWPSNLIDLAVKRYCKDDNAISFLTLLLKWGGNELVNDIGLFGLRPLSLLSSKAITSLFIDNGAHIDAASVSRHSNPHLNHYFSSPLSLTCLSARCILSESIPYQLIDLPRHIIEFIALHDPANIHFKINLFREL